MQTLEPKPTGGTLLKTTGLRKSFYIGLQNEVEVLKDVNVEVEKGDFVIIFGPSGCGKSTLLHTLLGLEAPTSGNVVMDGNDYYSMTDDKRADYRRHHVGIIYQQPLWIAALNIKENVKFTLNLLNYDNERMEKRVDEVLAMVGMSDWKNYRPQELSSGQQQKVSLARALSIDPILIVADEPTGNLDTVSGQQLIEHFMEFNKRGITIIMVTHDLEYLKYGNKIVHMIDGMVIEQYIGKPGQSFNRDVMGKKSESKTGESGVNVRDPKFLVSLKGEHDGKIVQLVDHVDAPKDAPDKPPVEKTAEGAKKEDKHMDTPKVVPTTPPVEPTLENATPTKEDKKP